MHTDPQVNGRTVRASRAILLESRTERYFLFASVFHLSVWILLSGFGRPLQLLYGNENEAFKHNVTHQSFSMAIAGKPVNSVA